MFSRKSSTWMLAAASVVLAGASVMPAHASSLTWSTFIIRNGTDAPSITANGSNGVTTSITESGQKTGFGTTGVDGLTIGSLGTLTYTRADTGTGVPYVNIWVTDGTNYALIAPVSDGLTGGGYGLPNNVEGLNLQDLGFNIYDNSAGTGAGAYDWLMVGAEIDAGPNSLLQSDGQILTLADIANLKIGEPATAVSDTGAPQNGDGFNIVFGDTQGNFTQPDPYVLSNVQLTTAVPLPSAASMGLGMLGLIGAAGLLRKKLRTA